MAKLSQEVLSILIKLKDKGISNIHIDFSGSGDSGDIDDLTFYDINETYNRKHTILENNYITEEEYNTLLDNCYDYIDYAIEGADWYNNDGGYGNIDIDLDAMTANVDYYQRTTEDHSWQDLSLFDI